MYEIKIIYISFSPACILPKLQRKIRSCNSSWPTCKVLQANSSFLLSVFEINHKITCQSSCQFPIEHQQLSVLPFPVQICAITSVKIVLSLQQLYHHHLHRVGIVEGLFSGFVMIFSTILVDEDNPYRNNSYTDCQPPQIHQLVLCIILGRHNIPIAIEIVPLNSSSHTTILDDPE